MMFNYGNTFDANYMEPHAINTLEYSFIQGFYLNKDDMWLCDALSTLSRVLPQVPGAGLPAQVLSDPKLLPKWGEIVTKLTNNYYKKFPEASALGQVEMEPPVLNHFDKKTGRGISIEKDRGFNVASRHLGYITFLSDVEEGGTLNWYFQNVQIKPEKGLTIVFPANWTYINTIQPSENNQFDIMSSWTRLRESTGSRMKIQKPQSSTSDDPVKYNFDDNFLDV